MVVMLLMVHLWRKLRRLYSGALPGQVYAYFTCLISRRAVAP